MAPPVMRSLIWRTVAALAFCTPLAFGADVCRGLPAGPPSGADYLAAPTPRAFRVSVKPGGPAFRVTVRPLLLKWRQGSSEPVRAGEIEVAACAGGKPLQVLPVMAWQPIDFAATFQARDIDFDGYLDFDVLTEFAAKWGSRSYWVYNPASGRFAANGLTRALGENCLGAEWHGGCWKANSIDFDPVRREIAARYLVGVGRCGSPVDRYRVENGRLVVVHKEILKAGRSVCSLTKWDLVNGAMVQTGVQRFNARGRPLK